MRECASRLDASNPAERDGVRQRVENGRAPRSSTISARPDQVGARTSTARFSVTDLRALLAAPNTAISRSMSRRSGVGRRRGDRPKREHRRGPALPGARRASAHAARHRCAHARLRPVRCHPSKWRAIFRRADINRDRGFIRDAACRPVVATRSRAPMRGRARRLKADDRQAPAVRPKGAGLAPGWARDFLRCFGGTSGLWPLRARRWAEPEKAVQSTRYHRSRARPPARNLVSAALP